MGGVFPAAAPREGLGKLAPPPCCFINQTTDRRQRTSYNRPRPATVPPADDVAADDTDDIMIYFGDIYMYGRCFTKKKKKLRLIIDDRKARPRILRHCRAAACGDLRGGDEAVIHNSGGGSMMM